MKKFLFLVTAAILNGGWGCQTQQFERDPLKDNPCQSSDLCKISTDFFLIYNNTEKNKNTFRVMVTGSSAPPLESHPACPEVVDRGCPLDGELSGHNQESMSVDHSGSWFGNYHTPCILKTAFVDF